jgi:hypothetical protein
VADAINKGVIFHISLNEIERLDIIRPILRMNTEMSQAGPSAQRDRLAVFHGDGIAADRCFPVGGVQEPEEDE